MWQAATRRRLRWVWKHPLGSAGIAFGLALSGVIEAVLMAVVAFAVLLAQVTYYWFRYGDNPEHSALHFALDNPLVGVVWTVLWFQIRVFFWVGVLAGFGLLMIWAGRAAMALRSSRHTDVD